MMFINLNDNANLNTNGGDYRCINGISKSDALNLLKNVVLTKKESYKDKKNIQTLAPYIKWLKKL